MTLHPPRPARKTPAPRREPAPLTLGLLLGDQIRAVQSERTRRAELEDMGFRPLKGAP